MQTLSAILLQGAPSSEGLVGVLAALLALVLVGGGYAYYQLRQQRQGLEMRLRALLAQQQQHQQQHQQASGEGEQRNAVLFDQHRRLNDLQIAKISAEVELLNRQVKSRSLDEDRMEASKEYHELMVEKTKLEMDSLRLHIAELRKRMEDWHFGQE